MSWAIICFLDCGGFYQVNEYSRCNTWFDYNNCVTPANGGTCDGDTRMSLSSTGLLYASTSSALCETTAPYQGFNYEVKLMCQQICDYCPPVTTSTTTSTTTTADNRRKYQQ